MQLFTWRTVLLSGAILAGAAAGALGGCGTDSKAVASDAGGIDALAPGLEASTSSPPNDAGAGADAVAEAGRPCSADGWCWSNPLPQGNTLNAAWKGGASDLWAVGENGSIVHFDRATWTLVSSGTTQTLHAV
jgi:hypothetical protein